MAVDWESKSTEELKRIWFSYQSLMVDSLDDLTTPTVKALAAAIRSIRAELKKRGVSECD